MDGRKEYIKAVEWLVGLYDFLNNKYFEDKLLKPVITVSPCEKNKTLGHFVLKEIWQNDEKKCGWTEINISSNFLNRTAVDIAETMLHEMCHEYAYINKIQDCSRSGTYHNKLYAQIAEKHGLIVQKVATHGYALTSLTAESKEIIQEFAKDTKFIYRLKLPKGVKVKSCSTRKYICPCCNQSIRATKRVNIICADCNEFMNEEN